jgi:hypothetical protein
MRIRTLLLNPDFPACLHCGKHLARQTIANALLRSLAHSVRVFPFACEGCNRRIIAFTWPGRYVEWDGQILVMPDRDNPLRTFQSECRDHFFFYVFLVALCLLVVWSAIHGANLAPKPSGISAQP